MDGRPQAVASKAGWIMSHDSLMAGGELELVASR